MAEPRWGHLIDHTYDGLRRAGQLSGGLGQLIDGVKGQDNFSHNNGFEWVGWKSMNGDVVIEFTFKTLRNFTGALFHSNNLFSSGVEVFQGVDVHYGIDVAASMEALRDSLHEQRRREALLRPLAGQTAADIPQDLPSTATLWSTEVNTIEYEPDKKLESARPVTVHLKHRLANKLRFVLKFASKWILVSEVEFLSHPVELMALSSLSADHTPPLLNALSPAKTYDQFMAILREDQLRRIASAYVANFQGQSVISSTPSAAADPNDQPEPEVQQTSSKAYDDGARDPRAGKRVTGPPISTIVLGPANQWPPASMADGFPMAGPEINPLLTQTNPPQMYPPAQLPPGPFLDSAFNSGPSGGQREPLEQAGRRAAGLMTVISFALVAILLLLAVLFLVSSYRLRHQPKLGAPQLGATGKGFMSSVFASSSASHHNHHQHHQRPVGGQSSLADSHYNPLFASHSATSGRSSEASLRTGPVSTLKRLATLAGGKQQAPSGNLLFGSAMGGQANGSNQLLVSVKDSLGKGNQQQSVNTQLIVGLNQSNPLNQPLYGAHYSASMSMASSSTNGGQQGDYSSGGDYAIPDAQPMLGLALNSHHQHHNHLSSQQHHFNHLSHLQQQQQGFNGAGQQPFKQPFVPGLHATELRGSNRMLQPLIAQQQQQQNRLLAEHNYELICGGEPSPVQRLQANSSSNNNNLLHQRTLSNQMNAPSNQCQPLSSMTLQRTEPLVAARRQAASNEQRSTASSGGSLHSTGGQTSSANSTSGLMGPAGDSSHYYYSSTEAAKAAAS